jgi:hypothetical protein
MARTNPVKSRSAKSVSSQIWEKSPEEIELEARPVASVKRTFHLEPEVVLLLNELQLEEFRQTGKKPHLSGLVEEAVRLLGETRRASAETQAKAS